MSEPENTPPPSTPDPAELLGRALESHAATGHPQDWAPPSPQALQMQLQGYVVSQFLARGGMGAVYRGVHVSLDRQVAIKILPPQLRHGDPQYASRFKQEARAMAQLNHPGIVSVYDFGQMADGTLYFIMEFIDGTDVGQMVLKQGRLSSAHAMAITAHVCDALQYAHERGIVHRDIKPANIMVGYDGRVKVADFGLAKSVLQADTGLTQSGYVMGTPHFVAPEALIIGMQVDHRADIYAVGVMLYQMLTGKVPRGLFEMPSLQVPGLDPRYDQIIARSMREDREQRFPSVLDLRRALDGILTQPVQKSGRVPQAAELHASSQEATVQSPQPPVKPPASSRQSRSPQASRAASAVRKKTSSSWWWVAAPVAALILGILTSNKSPSPVIIRAPETATQEQPFVNSLGMSFVPVPGTRVLMCQHETRRQDYQTYAEETPGTDESWRNQQFNHKPCGHQDDHPVLGVSWTDAKAFCEWLGKKEKLKVRLPTDREWSQAAGIAKDETWDAQSTPKSRDCVLKTYTWGPAHPPRSAEVEGNYGDATYGADQSGEPFIECYDGFPTTAPVKSFHANGFGLHDLGGNAREWVEDLWDTGSSDHVLRGSAWHSTFWNGMVTSRRQAAPADTRSYETGFRCVIEMPEVFPDQLMPKVVSPFSPVDDPAFEKQLGSYSWRMRQKDWVAYFGPNHEALVREGDEYRMWHWWVVGPRTIHVQFASQAAQFDPGIGEDRRVDPDMTTMTRLSNKEVVTDRDRSIDPASLGSEDGFITLLGREGTDGWTYSGPPGAGISQADGITSFAARPAGDKVGMFWYSKRTFADFVLRLDFKITDFQKNSGVHLRLPALVPGGQPTPYSQGAEVEIFHQNTGRIPFVSGSTSRPPRLIIGDWNTYEITARGPEVTVNLNGVHVHQQYNTPGTSGYIGIQDYDDNLPMEFRNVRIKDLSGPAAASPSASSAAASATADQLPCTTSGRLEALRRTGGSPEIERAVTAALEYLKSRQNPDGSWGTEGRAGKTALALMAYAGRCETPDSKSYGDTVIKGFMFLIETGRKNSNGSLVADSAGPHAVTEHCMAAEALGQAYLAARRGSKMLPGMREVFENAVRLMIEVQSSAANAGAGSGLALAWQAEVLNTARLTHLKFTGLGECSGRVALLLQQAQNADGGFGRQHSQGVPLDRSKMDLHAVFQSTRASFKAGGDEWLSWHKQMLPQLLATLQPDGSISCPPSALMRGDAVDNTALGALTLETYFQDMPDPRTTR
ncbi:protein kinase domain-containing protein [Brevifollis gellanilyticus]|uniref:Protein kinase domain-containing protein n=1 Tax=Brevifollis gellanilyticus TaxID=748831 RepID=A0A512MFW9_9BACT|nr:protein kinase [Brevifollis gellanilyticus]GEP45634.1 hypothetical protein BGE01nite_49250 [Brevifollis gellanilyticus]